MTIMLWCIQERISYVERITKKISRGNRRNRGEYLWYRQIFRARKHISTNDLF